MTKPQAGDDQVRRGRKLEVLPVVRANELQGTLHSDFTPGDPPHHERPPSLGAIGRSGGFSAEPGLEFAADASHVNGQFLTGHAGSNSCPSSLTLTSRETVGLNSIDSDVG